MSRRVELIASEILAEQGAFRLERARFRHQRFDGEMSEEIERLNFQRGDSVAGLLHLVDTDEVVLTEQFRYPAWRNGPGWMLEIPAGMLVGDSGEDAVAALQRELMEEVGYRGERPQLISTFYPSVGASSERIHLYYLTASRAQCVAHGGGCMQAGEDIRRVELPLAAVLQRLDAGEIIDAKTIIGLQWLRQRAGT